MNNRAAAAASIGALLLLVTVLGGCTSNTTTTPTKTTIPEFSTKRPTPPPTVTAPTFTITKTGATLSWSVAYEDGAYLPSQVQTYVEYGRATKFDHQSEPVIGRGAFSQPIDLAPATYTARIALFVAGTLVTRTANVPFEVIPSSPISNQPVPELRIRDVHVVFANQSALSVAWTLSGGKAPVSSMLEYGLDTGYGGELGPFTGVGDLGATISGLSPGLTIHYRIVVQHGKGSDASPDAFFLLPPTEYNGAAETETGFDSFGTSSGTSGSTGSGGGSSGSGCDQTAPVVAGSGNGPTSPTAAPIVWSVADNLNDPMTQVQVAYGVGGSLDKGSAAVVGLGNKGITLLGLTPATTYTYQVVAVDSCGNIGVGPVLQFATPAGSATDISDPTVTSVFVYGIQKDRAFINWTAADDSGIATSRLEYSADPDMSFSQLGTPQSGLGEHMYFIIPLSPGTIYNFRVRVTDGAGNSITSVPDQFQAAADVPVVDFVNLDFFDSESFTVSWSITGEPSTVSYIEFGESTAYELGQSATQHGVGAQTATITGLSPSTLYHWRVAAKTGAVEAIPSPDDYVVTP